MKRIMLCASVMLFTSCLLPGQAARPAFEVASVKPAPPITPGQMKIGMNQDPGRISYSGLPLRALIARAYRVKDYQINGPDWLNSQRFDIVATLPSGAKNDQVPEMLQTLLEDRFQLKFHREPKETPVYGLVVAKGGLKIKEVEVEKDARPNTMVRMQLGHLDLQEVRLGGLADVLSRLLDRPVVDMTETKGAFNIKLDWAQDLSMLAGKGGVMVMPAGGGEGPRGEPPAASDPSGPSIFTAVQEQLGLKLEPRKAPVEILVIDHAEKVPTEN